MKQVAVVGGSQGLGNAIVDELIKRKYRVVVLGRSPSPNPQVLRFYPIDAASLDWASMLARVEGEIGTVFDHVVFVSGRAVFGKTAEIPSEDARACFELNFWGCSNAARAVADHWSRNRRRGRFLAVLSIVARRGIAFEAYYSASKAAAARFLECLQLEYADTGVDFLAAFPGMLNTSFRSQAQWIGMSAPGVERGSAPAAVAYAIVDLLETKRRTKVIGWREQSIDFADRLLPGLYEKMVLGPRLRKHRRAESRR